jgi:hypothetical protein
MSGPHPLGLAWEAEFERDWDKIFKEDLPNVWIPLQTRRPYPFKLENVVRAAMAQLRKELGGIWLPNRLYGSRLHAAVHRELDRVKAPAGWQVVAEQPLRTIGWLSPGLLKLSIRQYLDGPGQHLRWLRSQLSTPLYAKVGDIKPDLLIRRPDGVVTIWDLTSREQQEHMAKTVLYANLLTRDNQLARIGETYWLRFR